MVVYDWWGLIIETFLPWHCVLRAHIISSLYSFIILLSQIAWEFCCWVVEGTNAIIEFFGVSERCDKNLESRREEVHNSNATLSKIILSTFRSVSQNRPLPFCKMTYLYAVETSVQFLNCGWRCVLREPSKSWLRPWISKHFHYDIHDSNLRLPIQFKYHQPCRNMYSKQKKTSTKPKTNRIRNIYETQKKEVTSSQKAHLSHSHQ